MNFEETIQLIARILHEIGTDIDESSFDGVIVKRLESSNTMDKGRTTKQSHIAITGPQMDMFPYVRADGYFEVDYSKEDSQLKKYFVAQIPAYLHKENVEYLNPDANLFGTQEKLVHISIVRSRRKDAPDQLQMSMVYMDSPTFIEYRRIVHAGSYMIVLKRKKELKYDIYVVKPSDANYGTDSLADINNCFAKQPTNTKVPLDDIFEGKQNERVIANDVSPEWFKAHTVNFPNLDSDAKDILTNFHLTFGLDKLRELEGEDILNTIFLNNANKTNLCFFLEYDNECRNIFGSIKNGTAYKYGLHYSKKNSSWATKENGVSKFLSVDEAIELGSQIRDSLIAGAELIASYGEIKTIEDYQNLYNDLFDITDGYVNRVWFMKYYALLFPELFPPIYSTNAQNIVLNKLAIKPEDNPISRMGQIREYAVKCDISNVMFSKIFWTFCNGDNDKENCGQEDDGYMKNCLEIIRQPRTEKTYPLNFIIYGAPGTGKTYSTIEYALSIIYDKDIDSFRKENPYRKENVTRYKELVKAKQIVFTTFHQNYGYEEFIQGLRPNRDSEVMAFKTVDGIFKVIADNALNDKENKKYVIIIDEINRANISKVFGELITLIEEDKRWGELNEMSATLQSGDYFAVPNNLYIIGTMNSADKSISLIDAALRRRFVFIEQKPDASLIDDGVLKSVFKNINENLVCELDSTDLLVGHSYFMEKTEADLCEILNNNIIPLLYEYFYDNRKKVAMVLKNAIDKSGAQIEIIDEKFGRLRVKDK